MAAGDTLVVPSLDRLSRSLQDLITTVGDLRRRGIGFTSLHESLDTTTPGGRLVFTPASPLSPGCSVSAPAPSTTTSPTCASYAPGAS